MIAEIIGVGRAADTMDSLSQIFAREVSLLGVDLHFQTDAGSDRMQLAQAMAQALRRSDIIITVGGLGLDSSDVTKDIICQGLSIPLDLHAESYQRIRNWYEVAGLPVPSGAQRASLVPRGGVVFPGEDGNAPGVAITAGDQCILMLPGAPDQLCPMFLSYVVPFLAKFAGATVVSRVARVFGVDERETVQRLYDLQNSRNPVMTLYSHKGEVLVRVTARANNRQQAANMCTPFLKEIVGRMGDYVYGIDVDSLESVVVTHLTQKGTQLATAESGTGGQLTQRLNLVPGAAGVFKFGISAHANRVKTQVLKVPERLIRKYGTVSERVAVQMACGAMDAGDANMGLAITLSDPGADSASADSVAYLAACTQNHVIVKRLSFPAQTPTGVIREAAVSHALNLIRLILDYNPDPAPGAISLGAALKGKIELCDNIPPVTIGEEFADIDKASRKRGDRGGVDPRTIIMTVLLIILAGAICFIGYALYERYLADTDFSITSLFSSSSESDFSSSEAINGSESEEESSSEESSERQDESSASMIGPAIGGRSSQPEEDDESDASSEEDSSLEPVKVETPVASMPAATPMVSSSSSASSSSKPQNTSSVSSSSSVSAASSVSSSSSGNVSSVTSSPEKKNPIQALGSNMVFNVFTGKYSVRSSSEEDDEGGKYIEEDDGKYIEEDEGKYIEEDDGKYIEDKEDSDKKTSGSYSASEKITVKNGSRSVTAPMQEIIERMVQIEMGSSFRTEALKAQAVAAYSYVEYALARGQTPSVSLAGRSSVSTKVSQAVESVFGEEILYDGKVINATYFASSAGVTNNSEDVWSSALPYLRSVDSDESVSKKTFRLTERKMRSAIKDALGFDPDDYGSPDEWISDISYCKNDVYVDEVEFCGRVTKSGVWIRSNMITSLTSHAFEVEYDDGEFVFTVYGSGHGVGMSQMGAQAMAADGYSYDEILEYYYSGTRVR